MSENLTTLHAMTLDQAKAIEESIGYRYDWTTDQLFEATAHMTRSDLEQFIKALEITATAARQEAHALESYVASRSNGKGHE